MEETRNQEIFKCLADQTRLSLLGLLLTEDSYVELLAVRLSLTPATVCYHLKKMEEVGLVRSSRSQFYVIYSVNRAMLETPLISLIPCENPSTDKKDTYRKEVLSHFFRFGRLTRIPVQQKKRIIVLHEIAQNFEPDRTYPEPEVNEVILKYHPDYCTIRRWLVEDGLMTRDHEVYRRV